MQSQQDSPSPDRQGDEQRHLLEDLGLTPGTWGALLVLPFFKLELLKQQEMYSRAINREPEANWMRSSLRVNERIIARAGENLTRVLSQVSSPTPGTLQGINKLVEKLLAIEATPTEQEALLKRGIILLAWHLAEKLPEKERSELFRRWESVLKDSYRHQSPESFHLALRDITQLIEHHTLGESVEEIKNLAPLAEVLPPEERLAQHWKTIAHRLGELHRDDRENALKEIRTRLCEVHSRPLPFEVELALGEIAHLARQLTNIAMAEDSENEGESSSPPSTPSVTTPGSLEEMPPLPVTPKPPPPPIVPTSLPVAEPPRLDLIQSPPLSHTSWEDLQSRIQHTPLAGIEKVLDSQLLFDDCRQESASVAIVREEAKVPDSLWIVSDIHADPVALHYAWLYIRDQAQSMGRTPSVVFLGDFVDRGPYSHETLLYLFNLLRLHPDRICVLPGNHDVAFSWQEDAQRFQPGVEPSEYPAYLNALLEQDLEPGDVRIGIARLAESFFQSRPRAVILPDGLLLAHAGFPHTDLQESLAMPADLSAEQCLRDFLWLRINPTPTTSQVIRDRQGGEFGPAAFNRFCEIMTKRLGIPVKHLVRGHDHVPGRYQIFPEFAPCPVLTFNTMSRRLDDETGDQFPLACVAHYQSGQLPEVHQLRISQEVVRDAFFGGSSTPSDLFQEPPPDLLR